MASSEGLKAAQSEDAPGKPHSVTAGFEDWITHLTNSLVEELRSEPQFGALGPDLLQDRLNKALPMSSEIQTRYFGFLEAHQRDAQLLNRRIATELYVESHGNPVVVGFIGGSILYWIAALPILVLVHFFGTPLYAGRALIVTLALVSAPVWLGVFSAPVIAIAERRRIRKLTVEKENLEAIVVEARSVQASVHEATERMGEAVRLAAREVATSLLEPSLAMELDGSLSAEYLSEQPGNPQLVLATDTSDELLQRIWTLQSGTFAIAGERGVGKTATLLRLKDLLESGARPSQASADDTQNDGGRNHVIMIPTPKKYGEREFILATLERLARKILTSHSQDPDWPAPYWPGPAAAMPPLANYAVLAGFAVLAGTGSVTGSVMAAVGIEWQVVAGVMGGTLGLGGVAFFLYYDRFRHFQADDEERARAERPSDLVIEARQVIDNVIYDRTLILGGEVSLGVGPVSAGASIQTSRTVRPYTLPGAIDAFKNLSRCFIGDKDKLVIILDEVDKMNTSDIGEFLREIKALFGLTHCFFLLSISEDAAAKFQERGVLGRNELDSSFDEVFRMRHMNFETAEGLVASRVKGGRWPRPYAALVHLLAAGNARDSIRYARQVIMNYRLRRLPQASESLIRDEFIRPVLSSLDSLFKAADLHPQGVASIRTLMAEEMDALLGETSQLRVDRLSKFASSLDVLGDGDQRHRNLRMQLNSILAFLASVLDVLDPDQLKRILQGPLGVLDSFADARRALVSDPNLAILRLIQCRKAVALDPLPFTMAH